MRRSVLSGEKHSELKVETRVIWNAWGLDWDEDGDSQCRVIILHLGVLCHYNVLS